MFKHFVLCPSLCLECREYFELLCNVSGPVCWLTSLTVEGALTVRNDLYVAIWVSISYLRGEEINEGLQFSPFPQRKLPVCKFIKYIYKIF